MAKKNLSIIPQLILLVGLFASLNSCDACKNKKVSNTKAISFEIELFASKNELLPSEESVITLTILSNDNRAANLEYSLDKIELTHGKLLWQETGKELEIGTKLNFREQKLVFEPSKEGGDAAINLTVVSSEGYASTDKIDIKVMDVKLDWQVDTTNLSAYKDVPISLNLSSSYQKAQDLNYTIKEIESIKGTLVFEDSGKEIKAGSSLTYGEHKLIFKPSGELGEASVKLTVISSGGHEISTTFRLEVKPIDFQISMQSAFKDAFTDNNSLVQLNIASDVEEANRLAYRVKEVKATKGNIFFENSGEEVKLDDRLTFDIQKLIFKPSGELGEAVIHLTVVSSEGEERSATLTFNVKTVGFNFRIRSSEQSIFSNQEVEIELVVEANYRDWRSPSLTFYFKDVEVSFGSLTSKLTQEQIKAKDPIELTYLGKRLNFNPIGKGGKATINLTVVSSEGEERSASVTINVKTVDFDFKMRPVQDHIFSHQKAMISMQSQISVQMAPRLNYTVKQIEASFGSLSFKNSGKEVTPGDTIKLFSYYKESLIFDPMGATGEATINLTVVSSEGIERSASVTIHIVPVDFDLEALAEVVIYKLSGGRRVSRNTVELKIIENKYDNKSLNSGPWHIISWSFSDGVKGKLMDKDEKEISALPIPFNSDGEARFCIDIGAVKIDKVPKIRFLIEGAQGTTRDVEVSLEKAQGFALAQKIEAYTKVATGITKQIEEFLPGGWQCNNYLASSEKIQEIRRLSEKADEIFNRFEKVRKQLSPIDGWWKGPALKSLIALNNAYGDIAID
ncbi:MAG: hypothetical protein ACYC2U_08115, partial [Candidatus Amoebophilus sp.]